MTRQVTIALDGQDAAADDLRSLYEWLAAEDELRGRIRIIERPPADGRLGPTADVILALQPALAGLATALVTWIRSRRSTVDVTVTNADGTTWSISTQQIRQLTPEELGTIVAQLSTELSTSDATDAIEPGTDER